MARLICAAVQLIIFTGLLCEQSTAKGVDYTVTVTVFGAQEQQVLEIPNIVQLQCTILPTPPFPVVYILSSSTQNHYLETSLFDAESRVGILIYERQPSIGRYFCHVLLASNRTTLAVGHITIFLSGILRPIESINKVFTPPAPLQMGVEIPPMFSHRRLLDSLRNITYEWKHNDTMLSDQVVNESSLVITPTSESDAGIYMVKIASFGLPNVTNEKCAAIILKHLTSYAIFQGVEFYAYNRLSYASYSTNLNGSGVEHSKSPHTMKEVLFVSGEPLRIDAIIQPQSYHIGVILQFQQVPLRLKLFYNGEQLPTNSQGGIKHPSEASSSFIRPTDELGVPVTFQLPMPTPEDEGLYEMQLFFEFDVSLLIPDCPDYVQLLQALDGLDFYETLIGSLTLMVHEQGRQGRPKVIIEATEQVISANSIESPPILTCSVVKDGNLIPANQIRWKKGGKTLAQTRVSETLILDTATNDNPTIFGMYTCEAIIDQNKSTAKRSILITERAHFKMEISPINSTRCLDLSEETMLDILLMELQLFSFEMDADFTSENFANFSLDCSSEGNSIAISTDVTYSNSDGSITASVLVETAEAWMNGIRTANGATFLIARPGPSPDTSDVSQHGQQGPGSRDIAVIILSILVFGLLVAGVVILSLLCVQRKYYKKKDIHQQNPLPLKRESVIINNSEITTSEPQTQILPTSISYDQLIEAQRSGAQLLVYREGKTLHSARVVPKAHTEVGRAIHLTNTQEVTADKRVTYTLLSLRPNHAYNRRKDALDEDSINQQGQTILTTHDGLNQNQMSVHYYDYPKVQKDGDTDSLGYQSINYLI